VVETVSALVAGLLADWRALQASGVQFAFRDDPVLWAAAMCGVAMVVLAVRLVRGRRPARDAVAVPALFGVPPSSRVAWVRHAPRVLAAIGAPLALLALADPFTALTAETVSYPGRRIALMIDASDSMQTSFKAGSLNTRAETEAAFFTTVAAAKRFVELRRGGEYKDLMALVEFGDRAYVITPFTSDYDNLLLSIALIGDPIEYSVFPDPGTVIASALEQSIEIFKAFDFLEASGNLMVIFTDGEDTTSLVHGKTLDEILKAAVDNAIPLYFVRTNYGKAFGDGIPDQQWQAAVEKTGGRYYVARDEATLLSAVHDIDRAAVGAIQTTQYTSRQPRFALFALGAAGCWLAAALLGLTVPLFSSFP
jgi:von Willebrand factor type A domain